MNNEQRDNLEEIKLAEETLRVLDGQHCETDEDSRTQELGRLLKQNASHDLPESNDGLREMLLAELEGEAAVPAAPSKTLAPETDPPKKVVDRIGRRRMWLAMPAAGLLLAVGSFWLYSAGSPDVAHNYQNYSSELDGRAKATERLVNEALKNDKGELSNLEKNDFGDERLVLEEESDSMKALVGKLTVSPDQPQVDKFDLRFDGSQTAIDMGSMDTKRANLTFSLDLLEEAPSKKSAQQGQQQGQQSQGQQIASFRRSPSFGNGFGGGGIGGGGGGVNFPVRGRNRGYIDRYATFHDFFEAELDDLYDEAKTEQVLGLESLTREQYAPINENQFVNAVGGAAVSTFSIDVDTASYANMRRFLNSGQMPPRDSIRIEELVNYFQYDYPQPKGDDPFSVNMELATCPWNDTHKLLRVGLKGKEVHVKERPATNVVYLIDVSGSMNSDDKLPLLKRGFQMMTKQLGENDRVSIVTYAGSAGVALEPTTGEKTRTINEAIERLSPGGSTHGSAGIELAYKLAQQHFISGGVNKVILATDGDLNVGVTDDDSLVKLIKQKASEGVFLTVLGFGTGNLQDGKLEKLADNGNGHYAYLDSNREAHRVLVQQLSGSLVTIAKDVKIQIEFNPAEVKSYRLIGYENRMLATKDFDDDRKDAGEIGAGHTVTAIYEIEPAGAATAAFTAPAGMKYQAASEATPAQEMIKTMKHLTGAAASGELATLALRYKKPDENESKRIEFAIKNDDKSFTSASDDFRFAASVAGFGMLLRGSEHVGASTPAMIYDMANESTGDDLSGYRAEFLELVRRFVPKDHVLGATFKRDDAALEATFERDEAVAVALGGFFDLDGDGISDLEKLKRMIVRNGGLVVASHDEAGNVVGEIDSSTRFFVLGPTPGDGNRKVFDAMANMKEQAERNSVEIIDIRKLLNWTGIQGDTKIERLDSRINESTGFKQRSSASPESADN